MFPLAAAMINQSTRNNTRSNNALLLPQHLAHFNALTPRIALFAHALYACHRVVSGNNAQRNGAAWRKNARVAAIAAGGEMISWRHQQCARNNAIAS